MSRTLIGTSGWSYEHWAGDFYPPALPPRDRLAHYGTCFPTVEVNATFYRLPSESMVRGWRERVPSGFAFAVKGSRFITHLRRLEGIDEALAVFIERLGLLGDVLEVVLWQLPPSLRLDVGLLDRFLAKLPALDGQLALGELPPRARPVRHAVEFRHASWLVEDIFAVLRAHGAALVHVSSDAMPVDLTITADFVYVRFHGLGVYDWAYPEEPLVPWARFLAEQRAAGRDAYVYFNNDMGGHAPRDAVRLAGMLSS